MMLRLVPTIVVAAAFVAQAGWKSSTIVRGVDLNAIHFVDQNHGWVGGDEGFVAATADGGVTWTPGNTRARDAINDIRFTDRNTGFALAGRSILASTDGGRSWRTARIFQPSEFADATPELYSIDFINKKNAWVVGSLSRDNRAIGSMVASTGDGGATWKLRTGPAGRELVHLTFIDDRRGWLAGSEGSILHTTDSGETWTAQTTGTTNFLLHVEFLNERLGWAVGVEGTILRTVDGGQTWIKTDSPVRSSLQDVRFANATEGWIAGREGEILRSSDGGKTWSLQGASQEEHLWALFVDARNQWIVGGNGLLLRSGR